ncbi:hypothetical protein [Candidatus Uabimicrobium sp. HlEnr_7]|uniref:hypothetical protein n=1 Tax=Candidatus Uabimicrobium helgolandensis TaxID=3095367 RepID=UPI003557961C
MRYFIILFVIISSVIADEVSEMQYVIHPHKPFRSLSFSIIDSLGNKADAFEIIDENLKKNITGKTLFSIGVELDLKIRFTKYETVNSNIVVQPGIGPMLIQCDKLTRLRKQHFLIAKDYHIVDGVKYPYEFFVEKQILEKHLISKKKTKKGTLYTLSVSRFASKIKISSGFYFERYHTTSRTRNVYKIKNINVIKFIAHLKSLENRGAFYIINKVSRFVRSHQSYLKRSRSQDIEALIEYLLSFDLSTRSSMQLENILIELESF